MKEKAIKLEQDKVNLYFGRLSLADIKLITKFEKTKQRVK